MSKQYLIFRNCREFIIFFLNSVQQTHHHHIWKNPQEVPIFPDWISIFPEINRYTDAIALLFIIGNIKIPLHIWLNINKRDNLARQFVTLVIQNWSVTLRQTMHHIKLTYNAWIYNDEHLCKNRRRGYRPKKSLSIATSNFCSNNLI